uniref:neurofilament medium polypeptide-like isoform X2 n=1 Tax=Semicossyphus pulcher TaxID=241346 RepID=UPI0037E79690
MRTRPISEDEETEEDGKRRTSKRLKMRIIYITSDSEEDEEEEKEEEQIHQFLPNLKLLPVTCGNKTGTLDVEKLQSGEACIECEGSWFTPSEFETFGGKGQSKKWKASIYYDNKPLQFWLEQGSLTTKGFTRRGTERKRKIKSSNRSSDSSSEESETQAEEEDDVDCLPSSKEMVLGPEEGEEERAGAENGGGDDKSEEEDEMENGETEDENVPAVAVNDRDNRVFEGRETEVKTLKDKIWRSALQMKLKVVLDRLAEATIDRQSNDTARPVFDRGYNDLDEDAQYEEERKLTTLTTDVTFTTGEATHPDPPQMFTHSAEQREIKTEATQSASGVKPEILGACELNCDRSVGLSPDPLSFVTVEVTEDAIDDKEATGRDAAPQMMTFMLQQCVVKTSEDIQSSGMMEGPSSSCYLDTLDTEQLKREKIKMQMKVLKLQEEYFTLKIKKHKKEHNE